ncbi:MAG TPA: hypothetical protein VGL35_09035 [Rhizomicrobium sp.]|jgi:hypothetical protein
MDNSGHRTTSYGGSYCQDQSGCGVAFKVANQNGTWSESVIHNFCAWSNCADGGIPAAPLIEDAAGDFFGTTYGYNYNHVPGNAFELKPQ